MNQLPVYMIFGSGGILGSAFLSKITSAASNYRFFAFDHQQVDITDANHVNPIMEYVRPTVVINCAALNDEDLCQDAKTGAFLINSRGPQILAEACKKYNSKLVHFSSATVFDGSRCTPYTEKNTLNPINIHGQSKVSGEDAIKTAVEDHLIIRPGWVFSYENPSCIPSWISQAERGEEIAVLDEHTGSPTYALDLVDATMDLLSHDAKGIFHFANSNAATRQAFVEATLELSGLKTKISVVKADTQKFFKAQTPKYTVLSCKKYKQLANKEIRSWTDSLKHCLFNMQKYKP